MRCRVGLFFFKILYIDGHCTGRNRVVRSRHGSRETQLRFEGWYRNLGARPRKMTTEGGVGKVGEGMGRTVGSVGREEGVIESIRKDRVRKTNSTRVSGLRGGTDSL